MQELENLTAAEDENSEDTYGETEPFATSDETSEADISIETLCSNAQAGPSNNTSETQFKASTNNSKNKKRKSVDLVQKRMDEAYKILKTSVNPKKTKKVCVLFMENWSLRS